MHVIDYRILIQAPPEAVWKVVSDIKRNPEWQTNCKAVSILTNIGRNGPGMRWRATSASNKDYVVQVTAWYDRIGYEYTFTDGAPYKSSKGQVRLQETVEGTLVQWTFQYDLSGMLGGIKNSLGHKRALEKEITDSLQNLHKLMSRLVADARYESKSLMRDAPDVRARQQYKPRHPSVTEQQKTTTLEALRPAPKLDPFNFDPPRADEDTRPRPAPEVAPVTDAPAILSTRESPAVNPSVEPVVSLTEPRFEPIPASTGQEVTLSTASPVAPSAESPTIPEPQRLPDKLDTATVSVFDIFGIPRPSATQESQAVKIEARANTLEEKVTSSPALEPNTIELAEVAHTTSTSVTVNVESPNAPNETGRYARVGLRYKLRWELVKLCRP